MDPMMSDPRVALTLAREHQAAVRRAAVRRPRRRARPLHDDVDPVWTPAASTPVGAPQGAGRTGAAQLGRGLRLTGQTRTTVRSAILLTPPPGGPRM